MSDRQSPGGAGQASPAPQRAGLVLVALILVAAVANLNLSVANVALPDIGKAFDSGQVVLDLIAVGYSLGLACSVLWLGALGDRYGRKLLLIIGTSLAVPMSCLAAWAPSDTVLFIARVGGGLAAGMAYPTTLALITALWAGPGTDEVDCALVGHRRRDRGARPVARRPGAGALLVGVGLPDHVAARRGRARDGDPVRSGARQRDSRAGRQPRRHPLARAWSAALILAINFAPVPNEGTLVVGLAVIALAALVAFYIRQKRAKNPLYDLDVASRRTFWVAACAGIIVFGSLMGAMFVGQQFLQNVLGYSTLQAGAAILPAALFMVLVAPRSAEARERIRGAVHAARRLRLLPARLPHDAAALEGRHLLLEGRARLRVHGDRCRLCRHPGFALADRIGAGAARRDGVGNGRPAARPRRRDHAVDLRRAAHGRLRDGDDGGGRLLRQARSRTPPRPS